VHDTSRSTSRAQLTTLRSCQTTFQGHSRLSRHNTVGDPHQCRKCILNWAQHAINLMNYITYLCSDQLCLFRSSCRTLARANQRTRHIGTQTNELMHVPSICMTSNTIFSSILTIAAKVPCSPSQPSTAAPPCPSLVFLLLADEVGAAKRLPFTPSWLSQATLLHQRSMLTNGCCLLGLPELAACCLGKYSWNVPAVLANTPPGCLRC
jgi:hypothetical protein